MSRAEVLARHYEQAFEEARAEALHAEELFEYQYHRGLLSHDEIQQLAWEADYYRDAMYDAQLRPLSVRFGIEEAARQFSAVLSRNLATTRRRLQASDALQELLASHSAALTSDTLPPLERHSVSISAHGPPSGPASKHGAPLGIT